jgi:hypothetical protein
MSTLEVAVAVAVDKHKLKMNKEIEGAVNIILRTAFKIISKIIS